MCGGWPREMCGLQNRKAVGCVVFRPNRLKTSAIGNCSGEKKGQIPSEKRGHWSCRQMKTYALRHMRHPRTAPRSPDVHAYQGER